MFAGIGGLLGLIHVLIRLVNQGVDVRRVIGIKTDTDAGADGDSLILNYTRPADQVL